jgi:DNA-directed RNA polymerase alpha subunit
MSQFLISCKESRIETNRSFYSSFIIGPFHPSESITIATALRRSLLSELPGIGIISVQIEGAAHEYSNLPGIRDSVLDILLNLREVVLKKLSKNTRPQVGYLRARGPGTIVAGDLCLPPFIQCVDPNQHIATLAEDGVLNMKFIIAEGNNYIKGKPKMVIDINQFKKRRLILKKLDQVSQTKVLPSAPPLRGSLGGIRLSLGKAQAYKPSKAGFRSWGPPGTTPEGLQGGSSYLDNYYLYLKKKLKRKPDNQELFTPGPPTFFKKVGVLGSTSYGLSSGLRTESPYRAKVFLKLKPTYGVSPNSFSYKVGCMGSAHTSNFTKMANSKNISPGIKGPPGINYVNAGVAGGTAEEKELNNLNKDRTLLKAYKPSKAGFKSLTNKKLNRAIKKNSLTLNLLNVDAVFNPVINVNYIIEVNEHKLLENLFDKTNKISESLSIIRTKPLVGKPSYDLSPWESLFIKPGIKFNRFIYAKMLKKTISSEKDNLETKLTKSKPFLILKSFTPPQRGALFSLKQLLEYQINLERFKYFTPGCAPPGGGSAYGLSSGLRQESPLSEKSGPAFKGGGPGGDSGTGGVELISQPRRLEDFQKLANQKILKNLKKKQETVFEQFYTNTELVASPPLKDSFSYLNAGAHTLKKGGVGSMGSDHAGQEKDIKIWSSYGRGPLSEIKKDNVFHNNIILEVWTNGSIHPREAIYEALKYLIRLFSKLKTIKSIEPLIKYEASNIDFVTEFKNNSHNLFPLNQNSFLGKYASIPSNYSYNNKNKQTIKVQKNKQLINNHANLALPSLKAGIQLNSQIVKETLNATDISVLKIGLRPLMALKKKKIDTIGQLINCTKKYLLSIPYVGNKTVLEIEKSLLKIGLNFKDSTPPAGGGSQSL